MALLIIQQAIPLADLGQTAVLHDIKMHGHLSVDLSVNVPPSVTDAELRSNQNSMSSYPRSLLLMLVTRNVNLN